MAAEVAKPTTRPAWAAALSDREWLFVEAYAAELSGVKAALQAGFTSDRKSAREQACRMRKRPQVQEAINRLLGERVGASKARMADEISTRVIDEIRSIAFAKAGEAVSISDKLQALALLSKLLGLMAW